MHLETRLAQLDSAITMELWQEAYKVSEIRDVWFFQIVALTNAS